MWRLAAVLIFASAVPGCVYRERRHDVYVEPPRHEEHERREERREEHREDHHDHDEHRP